MIPAQAKTRIQTHSNCFLLWWTRLCLVGGSFALAWSLYFWVDAHFYQVLERHRFEAAMQSNYIAREVLPPLMAPETFEPAKVAGHPQPAIGDVLGRMQIERIGIDVMVLEGEDGLTLRRGAGHLPGTAIPGERGNVAIAAHRDTFFRALRKIANDDVIDFTTHSGFYEYRVQSIEVVEADNAQVLADTGEPALTLITCYPFYYVGPAPKRFIVRAVQTPDSGAEIPGPTPE